MKNINARVRVYLIVNGLLALVLILTLSLMAAAFNKPMSLTKVTDIIGFLGLSVFFAFMFVPANILIKKELDDLKIK